MSDFTWTGRVDTGVPNRWHQAILESPLQIPDSISLIGFSCDEGVKRNQGRIGARSGPNCIRKMLANLVYSGTKPLIDLGDIECIDGNLEAAQARLMIPVSEAIIHNSFPIILGGGHEVAWGTFQGIRKAHPNSKVGIINFDAHFDLRPLELVGNVGRESSGIGSSGIGSSGTPFRQAAIWSEENDTDFDYMVLGINPSANTPNLFNYAKEKKVKWHGDLDMNHHNYNALLDSLKRYCDPLDHIYLTICLDVFPAAYAPGVSAPASLGVDPNIVMRLLNYLSENYRDKMIALEIAEMNPEYDIDNRTASLAARLVQNVIERLA